MDRCYHIPPSLADLAGELALALLLGTESPVDPAVPASPPDDVTRAQLRELHALRDDIVVAVRELQSAAPREGRDCALAGSGPCPLFSLLWREGGLEPDDLELRESVLSLAGGVERGESRGASSNAGSLSSGPRGDIAGAASVDAVTGGAGAVDFDSFVVIHSLPAAGDLQSQSRGEPRAAVAALPAMIPIVPLLRSPPNGPPEVDGFQAGLADGEGWTRRVSGDKDAQSRVSPMPPRRAKPVARKRVCAICGREVPLGGMRAHVFREHWGRIARGGALAVRGQSRGGSRSQVAAGEDGAPQRGGPGHDTLPATDLPDSLNP